MLMAKTQSGHEVPTTRECKTIFYYKEKVLDVKHFPPLAVAFSKSRLLVIGVRGQGWRRHKTPGRLNFEKTICARSSGRTCCGCPTAPITRFARGA